MFGNKYSGMGPIGTSYGMSDNAGHIQPLTTGTMTADRSTSALSRMFSGGGQSTGAGLAAGAQTMSSGGGVGAGLGTAAGTAIGAYFGGPVGASVGGAIGGAAGSLFDKGGGQKQQRPRAQAMGDPTKPASVLGGLLRGNIGV